MIRFGNTKLLVEPAMGKLVRWLRILGFDTEYDPNLNMHHLVLKAKREYRILISCSENIINQAKKENVSAFMISNSEIEVQLQSMKNQNFDLSLPDFNQSRCPNCNSTLELPTIEEEERLVPTGTLEKFTEYYICRNCDQIYWKGSHWDNIISVLNSFQ